jgi:hypothetical protein
MRHAAKQRRLLEQRELCEERYTIGEQSGVDVERGDFHLAGDGRGGSNGRDETKYLEHARHSLTDARTPGQLNADKIAARDELATFAAGDKERMAGRYHRGALLAEPMAGDAAWDEEEARAGAREAAAEARWHGGGFEYKGTSSSHSGGGERGPVHYGQIPSDGGVGHEAIYRGEAGDGACAGVHHGLTVRAGSGGGRFDPSSSTRGAAAPDPAYALACSAPPMMREVVVSPRGGG